MEFFVYTLFFDWEHSLEWMLLYNVAVKADTEEGTKEGDGDSCFVFRRSSVEYIRNGILLEEFRYYRREK